MKLAVYDVAGALVRALTAGIRSAGYHEVSWDGTDAQGDPARAGIYFYRLATPDGTTTTRTVLVR